jgi:hypothetical protein
MKIGRRVWFVRDAISCLVSVVIDFMIVEADRSASLGAVRRKFAAIVVWDPTAFIEPSAGYLI